jgi:hypothetical protein
VKAFTLETTPVHLECDWIILDKQNCLNIHSVDAVLNSIRCSPIHPGAAFELFPGH